RPQGAELLGVGDLQAAPQVAQARRGLRAGEGQEDAAQKVPPAASEREAVGRGSREVVRVGERVARDDAEGCETSVVSAGPSPGATRHPLPAAVRLQRGEGQQGGALARPWLYCPSPLVRGEGARR